MWDHIGPIIAGGALLFSVATTILGFMLKYSLSQMETNLAKTELKLSKAITDSRNEIDGRFEKQSSEIGETIAAIRQKITDVEIWARDHFVRRDSFYKITDDLSGKIDGIGDKIDSRLERMEGKIDAKPKGHP